MIITKFAEKTILIVIVTSLIIIYASAIFVYTQSGLWPSFGNPKSYESVPLNQIFWWYLCIYIYISILVSIMGFLYAAIRLVISLFTKKYENNYILLIIIVLATFNLLDPFGIQDWFLD